MKVIVTGGSGFIGSHTLEALVAGGHDAYSVDLLEPTHEVERFEHIGFDFTDFGKLSEVFARVRPETVIHLGAVPSVQTSVQDPAGSYEANIRGTWNVLEAARLSEARRVVFASSAAVYGYTGEDHAGKPLSEDLPLRPKNPYGLAKKVGEELCELWSRNVFWRGVDTVCLRFFNVYGPRQRRDAAYATAIERFLHQWRNKEPFTIVPPGTQRRDMVFVGDVVRAILAAAFSERSFQGAAINVGSGKNHSVMDIADIIGGAGYPRIMIEPRPGDVREVLADTAKARTLLSWQPRVEFEEGIAEVKEHLTERGS